MRRAVQWLVDRIPIEGPTRRAVDQTLIDWRDECALATSGHQRVWRTVRAVTALLRVFAWTTMLELRELPRVGGTVGKILLWTAILGSVDAGWDALSGSYAFPTSHAVFAVFMLVVFLATAAALLPVGCFLGTRTRTQPILGLAAASALVTLLLVGWIVPRTNQAGLASFYGRTPQAAYLASGARVPAGLNERTLPELVLSLRGTPDWDQIAVVISARVALVAACPALLWLSAAVAGRARRRWWTAGIVAGYALLMFSGFRTASLIPVLAFALALVLARYTPATPSSADAALEPHLHTRPRSSS